MLPLTLPHNLGTLAGGGFKKIITTHAPTHFRGACRWENLKKYYNTRSHSDLGRLQEEEDLKNITTHRPTRFGYACRGWIDKNFLQPTLPLRLGTLAGGRIEKKLLQPPIPLSLRTLTRGGLKKVYYNSRSHSVWGRLQGRI